MTGGYKTLIFLFLSVWVFQSRAQEYDFSVNWQEDEAVSLEIRNTEFQDLNVRLLGKDQKITGTVLLNKNTRFTPYFPFSIGATYQVFDGQDILFTFSPQKVIKAPEVVNIFPLAEELPENFLKLYIKFDQPMATGHVYDYLHLLQDGKEIDNAFIPLKPELWDANKQILTVWIDPGRVKRDLGPNEKFGAVLKTGNTYQLLVNKGIKAANGAPMDISRTKTFKVIGRDEKIPSIDNWSLKIPSCNTKEALIFNMGETMDYSTHHFLSVLHNLELVEGAYVFISDTQISFLPEKGWKSGDYKLRVAAKAEDLAGNNFNRPFDLDLEKKMLVSEQEYYEIIFNVQKEN